MVEKGEKETETLIQESIKELIDNKHKRKRCEQLRKKTKAIGKNLNRLFTKQNIYISVLCDVGQSESNRR